jgi:hypothetical protein
MKTYNKNPEAVSLLAPEQYRVTQQGLKPAKAASLFETHLAKPWRTCQ